LIDENISVDDFVTKVNNLVTTSTVDLKEVECQPGTSSSFQSTIESPRSTVTTKRNLQIATSSPSKRIKQMKDGIDKEIERHKKGICNFFTFFILLIYLFLFCDRLI